MSAAPKTAFRLAPATLLAVLAFGLVHPLPGDTDSHPSPKAPTQANDDMEPDGLTNGQEANRGTDPEIEDTDGDGVPDLEDAVGYDSFFTFKAVPEGPYAVIDLGTAQSVLALNDRGTVVLDDGDDFRVRTLGGQEPSTKEGVFLAIDNADRIGWFERGDGSVDRSRVLNADNNEWSIPSAPLRDIALINRDDSITGEVIEDEGWFERSDIVDVEKGSYTVNSFWLSDNSHPVALVSIGIEWEYYYNDYEGPSPTELDHISQEGGENSANATYLFDETGENVDYSWSRTYDEDTEGGSEGYQVSAGAPSSDETPDLDSFNSVQGSGPVTILSPLLRNRNGDWVSREINIESDFSDYESETTDLYVFSDGNELEVADYSLSTIGHIDDQGGLWKSWSRWRGGDDSDAALHRLSTGGPAAGSPVRDGGSDGPVLAPSFIASNGLFRIGSGLWQNGRILTQEEILGPDSEWSNLVIQKLSDNGAFLAGTATKDGESHAVLLLKMDIVPDYDRDGVIRKEAWTDDEGKVHLSDYNRAATGESFRFWFNNDDDADAVGGPDIPGSVIHTGDSISSKVDGIRDLVDFFPLSINFHGLLDTMDLSKVKVQFTGPGVNWIEFDDQYSGISESLVNIHHRIGTLAEDWSSATTVWGGLASSLSERMLERIRDGRGVLLLEGRGPSTEPLMMEFSYDGKLLFKKEVPVKLYEVEDMYRHLNLIQPLGLSEGLQTAMGEPVGMPDEETNGKRFVFVHGYNVNSQQARGWNAEFFKRLYQSGSNAQYIAVYWWGYESQINTLLNGYKTPNYYKTAINAFQSAPLLGPELGSGGEITIAAHSLGNMLVSSAIADHEFSPVKYFLVNAAVAMEAYDGTADETANMRNEHWWGDQSDEQYAPRLYSANWHKLFSSTDSRSQLTWRNRFGALSQAYNFYSSGDQVFQNGDGTEPPGWDGFWYGVKSWYSQEYYKGRGFLRDLPSNGPTIRAHGGWGFDGVGYYNWDAVQAEGIPDSQLRFSPFFLPFEDEDPNYPDYDGSLLFAPDEDSAASAEAAKPLTRNKVLAEAIPAISFATGGNAVGAFGASRNFDINEVLFRNSWPSERTEQDWLHSDVKNIPYLNVRPFFDKIVTLGGLNDE